MKAEGATEELSLYFVGRNDNDLVEDDTECLNQAFPFVI
jgi:hypothetical protein